MSLKDGVNSLGKQASAYTSGIRTVLFGAVTFWAIKNVLPVIKAFKG